MTSKSAFLDSAVAQYVQSAIAPEHHVLGELRAETSRYEQARMAIGPEQGRFMQLLAHAIGARRYLEIGVFTGSSSLAMALALPPDGYILACDISEEYTAVARRYWKAAGVEGKIDLRLGPALETLAKLDPQTQPPFDMSFIDADKENVVAYYERALELVRPGGLILVDNVLWGGAVADESDRDESTQALRAVTTAAAHDARVEASLLPICDGLLICWKKT
ncbi:MAG TPA: class I SAM-dependent methyltransferase [Candidatus Cybelea sp.]|jgi:caffeoyl-CoA O-methyltransferase|nr:class I SAM-dependent methyltransferase [Candidatus Cybelea sp.]